MEKSIALAYGTHQSEIQIQMHTEAYAVGDSAQMKIQVDDALVRSYADQYGDRNPIHLNDAAGAASIFKQRIAHGMLSFNFFSTLLGAGFPGPGTIFTGIKEWRFTAPVAIGDVLSLQIKIIQARQKTNGSFDLLIEATAANGKGQVMSGQLSVIAPSRG